MRASSGCLSAAFTKAIDEAQPARHRQEIEEAVLARVVPHAQYHRVDGAVIAGEDLTGRARLKMREHLADIERLPVGKLVEAARQLLGERDEARHIGEDGASIERRIEDAAVAAPHLALGAQHAAAGAKPENAPDRVDARVIVDIILQHALDAIGVVDDKHAAPGVTPLDEQLLEHLLITGGERVGEPNPQQLPCR
jgi:hypothetical protein